MDEKAPLSVGAECLRFGADDRAVHLLPYRVFSAEGVAKVPCGQAFGDSALCYSSLL